MYSYVGDSFMEKLTDIKSAQLMLIKSVKSFYFDSFVSEDEFLDNVATNIKDKKSIVVFETNNISSSILVDIGLKLRQICSIYDSLLFINDRLDIFKITDADGIILNSNSCNLSYIQKFIPKDKFTACLINSKEYTFNLDDYDLVLSDNIKLNSKIKAKYQVFELEKI